jgi:hypothetical protein
MSSTVNEMHETGPDAPLAALHSIGLTHNLEYFLAYESQV